MRIRRRCRAKKAAVREAPDRGSCLSALGAQCGLCFFLPLPSSAVVSVEGAGALASVDGAGAVASVAGVCGDAWPG